jgi:hypothetical protein
MYDTATMALLHEALEAHGGIDLWNMLEEVQASLVSSGRLYDLKGQAQDNAPRDLRVSLTQVNTRLRPFGAVGQSLDFTDVCTAIEKADGTVVATASCTALRDSFAGHDISTPWNPLQRAYFSGYALWTYLNSPFLLTLPNVVLHPVAAVEHDGLLMPGIGAVFPADLPTHSRHQQFYFGADRLLRRHDYRVDIAGAFPASQYLDDFVTADGITVPATRRAYRNNADGSTNWDDLMVAMDFSGFHFSARVR